MAKLEFQLSTTKALNALKKMDRGIAQLRASLNNFNNASNGLDQLSSKLNNFRGINPRALSSIQELNKALRGIPTSAKIANINKALVNLSNIKVDRLAAAITRINRELSKLRVPPGLRNIAPLLKEARAQSTRTEASLKRMSQTMRSMQAPKAIPKATLDLAKFNSGLMRSSAAMRSFGGSLTAVTGLLAGFGIALGSVGLAQFIASAKEAVFTMDRFTVIMDTLRSKGASAARGIGFINQVARETATDIGVLADAFGKFSAAALNSNFTIKQTEEVFSQMSRVMRVLNLTTPDARLAFLALEQMISKGKVSMEELRRQLGERIPGAFGIMARALGVTTGKLEEMVTNGQVGSEAVIKFARQAAKELGGGLTNALNKPQAALAALGNAFFKLRESFGRGLFEQLMPGLRAFTTAIESGQLIQSFQKMGETIGRLSSQFLTFVSQNGPAIANTFNSIANGISTAIKFIVANADLLKAAFAALVAIKLVGFIGTAISAFISLGRVIVIAVAGMVSMLGPIGAIILAIGALAGATFAVNKAFDALKKAQMEATKSTDELNEATKRITAEQHRELQLLILQARQREAVVQATRNQINEKMMLVQALQDEINASKLNVLVKQQELSELQASGQATQAKVDAINKEIAASQASAQANQRKLEVERAALDSIKANAAATGALTNKAADQIKIMARQIELSGKQSEAVESLKNRNIILTGEWQKQADALIKNNKATADASTSLNKVSTAQGQVAQSSSQINSNLSQTSASMTNADKSAKSLASNLTTIGQSSTSLVTLKTNTDQASASMNSLKDSSTQVKTNMMELTTTINTSLTATQSLAEMQNQISQALQNQNNILMLINTTMMNLVSSMQVAGEATAMFGQKLNETNAAISTAQSAFSSYQSVLSSAVPVMSAAASAMTLLQMAAEKTAAAAAATAAAIADVISSASNAVSVLRSISSSFSSAASNADKATAAFNRAAAALRRLQELQGGDERGASPIVSGFRKGGVVSEGSSDRIRVRQEVFRNAPQFQTGTANTNNLIPSVSGGGIPAILHSNEAVIPLDGGGSVPVNLSGAMGGSGNMSPLLVKLLVVSREIKQEIAIGRENLKQQTVIIEDSLNNIASGIDIMIGWQVDTLKEITALRNDIRSGSFGGGGASSGSSISSSSVGNVTGGRLSSADEKSIAQANLRSLQNSFRETGVQEKDFKRGDLISAGITNLGFRAQFELLMSDERFEKQNKFLDEQLAFAQQFGTAEEIKRAQDLVNRKDEFRRVDLGLRENLNLGFFQTGSPNASRDMQGSGGFTAVLHPDEAVIPLPDGRRVPVDLTNTSLTQDLDQANARMMDLQDEFMDFSRNVSDRLDSESFSSDRMDSRADGSPGMKNKTVNVNVEMNITTPDANSFRQSQSQIMQELQTQLNESARRLGTMPLIEDPTKRVE